MPLWYLIQTVSCCIPSELYLNHWHILLTSCLVCTYLLVPSPLSSFLTNLHFAAEQYSESCGCSIQCKTISSLFSFPLLMYFQLQRHLPYLVLLVWLILPFLIYLYLLTATWIAILICLEHSFWITQQGSNPHDGFTKAWISYLETQCALVNQELNDYLRSKGSNDWFTTQYYPSEVECAECRKIVLNNLLCKFSLFHQA